MRHSVLLRVGVISVVRAQRLVAPRLVDLGIVIEIAERGGETVGAGSSAGTPPSDRQGRSAGQRQAR